jgi:hypothetical protein
MIANRPFNNRHRDAFAEERMMLTEQGYSPILTIDEGGQPTFRIDLSQADTGAVRVLITRSGEADTPEGMLPMWTAKVYSTAGEPRPDAPVCRTVSVGEAAMVSAALLRPDVTPVAVRTMPDGEWKSVLCPTYALGCFDSEAFYISPQLDSGFHGSVIVLAGAQGYRVGCSTNSGFGEDELAEAAPHFDCEHERFSDRANVA